MISQNRQAKLNERRNHLDLQINMLAEQETTEILRQHSGLRLTEIDDRRGLEQETRHAEIVKQIQGEIEAPPEGAADVLEEVSEDGTEPLSSSV
jgi:uncharacterized membrane protein